MPTVYHTVPDSKTGAKTAHIGAPGEIAGMLDSGAT